MEFSFHLIFEVFKIAILASIYSTIILLVFKFIGRLKPYDLVNHVLKNKIKSWVLSGFLISVGLFGFLFSYWGNHGLGDAARIPIGHEREVEQIDGNWTFIAANGYEMEVLDIDEFSLTKDYLFAKITSNRPEARNKEIAIWNLKTNEIEFLDRYSDLETVRHTLRVEETLYFYDFQTQYSKYWHGWRFWLLA